LFKLLPINYAILAPSFQWIYCGQSSSADASPVPLSPGLSSLPGPAPLRPHAPRPGGTASSSPLGRGSEQDRGPSGPIPCLEQPLHSDERSVGRSVRSGQVQPVMRSLRRNHGRPRINSAGRETRETVRSTVDRQQSEKPRSSEEAPGYRAVRGRGADERLHLHMRTEWAG